MGPPPPLWAARSMQQGIKQRAVCETWGAAAPLGVTTRLERCGQSGERAGGLGWEGEGSQTAAGNSSSIANHQIMKAGKDL